MSVNSLNINKTSPSFCGLPVNYRVAERIVRNLSNKGFQSSTYLNDIRYGGQDNFVNDYHKGLAMLKTAEAHTGIMRYRREFSGNIKCRDSEDYLSILCKIIEKVKMLNCGESAELVFSELKKLGIPCRIVSDKSMDHVFVVVNRSTPFTNYKNGKSGEFIADLWLKKVYKSVNEAYVEFKRLFDVSPRNELKDITDDSFKYSLMRPLTSEEKSSNEAVLERLFESINLLKKEVGFEAKGLKRSTSFVQGRNKGQIKYSFFENFDEAINRFELRRHISNDEC